MPALPPYITELIWEQFEALLPEHETDPPLSCHRRRIPNRIVFEKLVQILVFGCAYERIADGSCSESSGVPSGGCESSSGSPSRT